MRFKLPWYFSPFQRQPELLGHSGLSGAFALYAPARALYLAGTVNQLADRSASFQLMLQLAALAQK
jgi:CubicO group peptidase (beta-lactamase class C family)